MRLEDLIEARLAGDDPGIPPTVRQRYGPALAAHDALMFAVGETIGSPEGDRPPPGLPEDYELVGEVGRGGMGVVYRARQKSLGREVAVKVLRPGANLADRVVRRFLDEARHMARLRHPNVVAVHEVGQADGEPYLTMDFIHGESLASRLASGPLTPAHAMAILKQVGAAVVHAHQHGIVHRDLKPGNVLLDPQGQAYVTDFGLARDLASGSSLTHSGEVVGTPAYMAPEQAMGQTDQIGEATDVHALGAILYECLTGRPPFGHDAPAVVFARILREEPTPPRVRDRRIPRDLETICLKCLEKDPARRYPTARAVLEDLRRFEAGESISARRPGRAARVARVVRQQWKLLLGSLLVAGLAVALVVSLLHESVRDLRAWGMEREAAGDYAGAVDVYRRAWQKARGSEKDAVKEDLIRCGRATDDPKVAVAAAGDVMPADPYASFGRHDYVVAQAVLADLRARYPGRGVGNVPPEEKYQLLLAETRLKVFLNAGGGTAEERRAAEEALSAVAHALADRRPTPADTVLPEERYLLPSGTQAELKALADDPKQTLWDRGLARYALARQAEADGDLDQARQAAGQAFDQLRRAYPIYHGAASAVVIAPDTDDRVGHEAPEARLLREADALARRLDPQRPNTLRGGLRLTVDGVDWPADVSLDLDLVLVDAEAGLPDRRFRPYRRVPFVGPRAEVGVADGKYTLALGGRHVGHKEPASARFVRLLEIDADRLPKTVTVDGTFVDVKVPARLLAEITLTSPPAGAPFDPTTDFLRWLPVEGAASYRVTLAVQRDRAGARSIESVPEAITPVPRVCIGALTDAQAEYRSGRLELGATSTWAVEALDKTGRRIAASLESGRPFLVAVARGPTKK